MIKFWPVLMIICVSCMGGAGFGLSSVFAESRDVIKARQPLKVIIRPRSRKQVKDTPLISSEIRDRINKNSLDFEWKDILDHRFLSGYQDDEELKQYGYVVNSDMGRILQEKRDKTNDPDNLMHQAEYRGRQLYGDASLAILDPMRDIRQGCKIKTPEACSYTGYGQFWLKFSLRAIDGERGRADQSLVNLLKSLE